MGWRAVRVALDRSGLMKAQARALIEAASGRLLQVMFPLIAEPWEFFEARDLFYEQVEFLRARKKQLPTHIRYGAMLEVPALADALDQLVGELDFLSVGTNDLTQFLFAADRAHPRLAERYDWLSPAILRFLRRIAQQLEGTQVQLSVCGEMGGRPLEALALLGLGYRRLSITPAAVGPIKAMVRSLDLAAASSFMEACLANPPRDMRAALTRWTTENGVDIG